MTTIEFWYEFASPYSYPAAMRIEKITAQKGMKVNWCPFLLGPIFKAQGWEDSPFNVYPAKGAYLWRDMERICQAQGLGFQRLSIFPQNSILAARLALSAAVGEKCPDFSRHLYQAEFAENQDISRPETLKKVLAELDIDAESAFAEAASDEVKLLLRRHTQRAIDKNIFGAPSFVTADGELFWGNDRLEQAVAWAGG